MDESLKTVDRFIARYKYIKELVALKYQSIMDIKYQLFVCYLADLPTYENYVQWSFHDYIETSGDEDADSADGELL